MQHNTPPLYVVGNSSEDGLISFFIASFDLVNMAYYKVGNFDDAIPMDYQSALKVSSIFGMNVYLKEGEEVLL